jgi:hypothetical protein
VRSVRGRKVEGKLRIDNNKTHNEKPTKRDAYLQDVIRPEKSDEKNLDEEKRVIRNMGGE